MENERYFPKSRTTLSPQTVRIVEQVLEKIPPLPVSVQKIVEMTMGNDIGAKELAEVALTDPVLSSKVLTLVNSSYYALNRRIDDMRVAIVLIGFNTLQNIALQGRFLDVFENDDDEGLYNRDRLWVHSYLVSVCAESLLGGDNPKRQGMLATMGILHDIGKYALYMMDKMIREKGIGAARPEAESDMPFLKREEQYFGVNHSIVGGMLANQWNLSERICSVLEYHHHPSFYPLESLPEQYRENIAAISMSDMVVNRFTGEDMGLCDLSGEYYDQLGLNPPLERVLSDNVVKRLSKAREFILSIQDS